MQQQMISRQVFVDTFTTDCPHCSDPLYVTTTRPRGGTIDSVSVSHTLPNQQTANFTATDKLTLTGPSK